MPTETIHARAKHHFPSVLLTLLSIMQALSLEILWSGLDDQAHLWAGGLSALIGWLQVVGVVMGIMVIWLFYTTIVMRVTWVPSIGDLINPFLIGLCEFVLAELLAPEVLHLWIVLLAGIFTISNWTSMSIYRRARRDPDNADFFRDMQEYSTSSYVQPAAFIASLLLAGLAVYAFGADGFAGLFAVCLVLGLLATQVAIIRHYWKRTISSPSAGAPSNEP